MNFNLNLHKLKKESEENKAECWDCLYVARQLHPKAVYIDATLNDQGKPCFTTYLLSGEADLEQKTNCMLRCGEFREQILAGNGSLVFVPLEEDDNAGMDAILDLKNSGTPFRYIAPPEASEPIANSFLDSVTPEQTRAFAAAGECPFWFQHLFGMARTMLKSGRLSDNSLKGTLRYVRKHGLGKAETVAWLNRYDVHTDKDFIWNILRHVIEEFATSGGIPFK